MENSKYFHWGTHWIVQVFLNIADPPSFNRGRGGRSGAGVFFVSFALGWWARLSGEAVGF